MSKKTVLVITDGIGYSPKRQYNAFHAAKKPTYDRLFREVPHSLIDTFGLSVGLPEGQMGNSEVGHMSIGSGRVLYQDLVKISLSLEEGNFIHNPVFDSLLKTSKRIHLIGLLSDGGVHSHIDHIMGVAEIAAEEGKEVWLHLISDGRDVAPNSVNLFLHTVSSHGYSNIKIGSLGGRFFSMDRDNRWERVQKGYDAIVSATPKSEQSVADYIENAYASGETDEFITPSAFDGYEGFKDGDAVLMLNFRSDRMRELTAAIGDKEFNGFDRTFVPTHLATMTQYDKNFPYPVLFPKDPPKNTLAEVIARNGRRQLHTAETEKYAHVTFFFNGGIEEPYENETRVLIPSPQVKTYDMQPQMSAPEVGDAVIKAMNEGYDFVVVNFANGDMVGHTGNFEAAIEGVEAVDTQLGRIIEAAERDGYAMVLTSDHGNCEEMRDDAGNTLTNHTVGKVWCFVMAEGVNEVHPGALNNIAPTVLKLMGIEKPVEMDMPLI
ncbi:MAG: 2,3-bisphosphoglycerate-independent phosphoglycerate mutase [Sulfuricurvum sp.]|nr:2,3-bisphosphoglycerate-independent phosphoglycerate mutase [Sulfuricurvum sp.]